VERESSLEERTRKDEEKDEARKARQVRLGHVEAPKKKEEKEPAKKEAAPKKAE